MYSLYDNPKYYEIAFSFRSILSELDVFEECFKRFSQVPVRSVLELGCGTCPHMEEFIKRGYQYNGLDLNRAMLEYSRQKALKIGAEVTLFQEDMIDFSLERMVDFVYVLLGSLSLKNTSDLITHFNSVARTLKKGGLYLLDWCVQFDAPWQTEGDSWETEQNGIQVKTQVSWKAISRSEQTFEETIVLEVDDHGRKLSLIEKAIKRAVYPQEFLCFISGNKSFEFVGWWNNWDLGQPLERADKISRPIVLVRKI